MKVAHPLSMHILAATVGTALNFPIVTAAAEGQITADEGEQLVLMDQTHATTIDNAYVLGAINGGVIDATRIDINSTGKNLQAFSLIAVASLTSPMAT